MAVFIPSPPSMPSPVSAPILVPSSIASAWERLQGLCFLAFAWVGCGMLRRVSPFSGHDAAARATDTAGEACRAADAAREGEVTGGGEEALACLGGRCAGACRAPLRVMGMTRG